MQNFDLQETPHGSRLLGETHATRWHLDVPLAPDTLDTIIRAAFVAPWNQPRVEVDGVIADQIPTGVQVRVAANSTWFDISWKHLAKRYVN
ncbi:hypothetical protein ACERZ8_17345 [Tateyamaria armeniaca]|uniref:Uncharacterized protein n=1 Tax=Tateyamaria armeniaca TaxID=2518930 RepID=A0ABW8UWP0_9RHOB